CAPTCAAWIRSSLTPDSPAACSMTRCSPTCPKASTPAARTGNSTPASAPAPCSTGPYPCSAPTPCCATTASPIPTSCWPRLHQIRRAELAPLYGRMGAASATQRLGMMGDVVADEAGDEVVAVVVAGLHAQLQRMAGVLRRLAQQFGLQLSLQELVGVALVDQHRQL